MPEKTNVEIYEEAATMALGYVGKALDALKQAEFTNEMPNPNNALAYKQKIRLEGALLAVYLGLGIANFDDNGNVIVTADMTWMRIENKTEKENKSNDK